MEELLLKIELGIEFIRQCPLNDTYVVSCKHIGNLIRYHRGLSFLKSRHHNLCKEQILDLYKKENVWKIFSSESI